MNWYLDKNGEAKGPYSLEEIFLEIKPETLVWREESLTDWTAAKDHPLLKGLYNQSVTENTNKPEQHGKENGGIEKHILLNLDSVPWLLIPVELKVYVDDVYHSTHTVKYGFNFKIPFKREFMHITLERSVRYYPYNKQKDFYNHFKSASSALSAFHHFIYFPFPVENHLVRSNI